MASLAAFSLARAGLPVRRHVAATPGRALAAAFASSTALAAAAAAAPSGNTNRARLGALARRAGAAAAPHARLVETFDPAVKTHCIDRVFDVPLDWAAPEGEHIEVFAREVCLLQNKAGREDLPMFFYLQGGPGYPCARPGAPSGWMARALKTHRVVLVDMRGTGRSHPLTPESLLDRFDGAAPMAEHLTHFRSDAIVADCEAVRVALGGADSKVTLLGQSYGGFTALHYLCAAPGSVEQAFLTGGIPPYARPADDVYRECFKTLLERNARYYKKYPGDVGTVRGIVKHLVAQEAAGSPVALPAGGFLTARRFLTLGLSGLGGGGGFDTLHYLFEGAFRTTAAGEAVLTREFLDKVVAQQSYESNPIYALLHEAIYCQHEASDWSAARVLADEFKSDFDFEARLAGGGDEAAPVNFYGEMIFPWFFDGDFDRLAPLKECAEILAQKNDWPALYSAEALAAADVPVAAAVYYQDLYVVRQFSEETAALLPRSKLWITNEYQHSGLREGGEGLLGRLFDMVDGEQEIPS